MSAEITVELIKKLLKWQPTEAILPNPGKFVEVYLDSGIVTTGAIRYDQWYDYNGNNFRYDVLFWRPILSMTITGKLNDVD